MPQALLALHSSAAALGVGVRWLDGSQPDRLHTVTAGRDLSNLLIAVIEEVCPAPQWTRLARLAVAIGPGGFTSTRLTVVFARTLAQQLQLPLQGVGSHALQARRLGLSGPTWIVQELPRRGLVAGLYAPDPREPGEVEERWAPQLHADAAALAALSPAPLRPLDGDVAADVAQLLAVASHGHQLGLPAPWQSVLPLYPTAPVALD